MKTTGKLTEINPKSNLVSIDEFHCVSLEHAKALRGLNVDQLRERIGEKVTMVTDDVGFVTDIRFGNNASPDKGREAVRQVEDAIHHNLDDMGPQARESTFVDPTFLRETEFSVELEPMFTRGNELSYVGI